MGFFAIAHSEEHSKEVDVERCHLNLFVLSSTSEFIWDVGILLKNRTSTEGSTTLLLALPFATEADSFTDLGAKLQNNKRAAENIFGEPVTLSGNKITVASYGEPFQVCSIPPTDAKIVPEYSNEERSVWQIKVGRYQSSRTYARVRFKLKSPGRIWKVVSSTRRTEEVLVDFRVSDVRGTDAGSSPWNSLVPKIAEIEALNFFLMAPAPFHVNAMSPAPKHLRLLESGIWKEYLDGVDPGQLVAYHWEKKDDSPPTSAESSAGGIDVVRAPKKTIKPDRPFYVFVRLVSSRHGLTGTDVLLVIGIVVAVNLSLCGLVMHILKVPQLAAMTVVVRNWYLFVAAGVAGIFAFVSGYAPKLKLLEQIWGYLRSAKALLSPRPKP